MNRLLFKWKPDLRKLLVFLVVLFALSTTIAHADGTEPVVDEATMTFKIYGISPTMSYPSMKYPELVHLPGIGIVYRVYVIDVEESAFGIMHITLDQMDDFVDSGVISVVIEPSPNGHIKIYGEVGSLLFPIQTNHR